MTIASGDAPAPPSTALLTDHYELTMLEAALQSGTAERRCVFEVFARRLPDGRRYGVVAGTGRLLAALAEFRFGAAELAALEQARVIDAATLEWLAGYRFAGDVWGYGEGETFVPGSPILVVEGSFAEAVVLETLVLSILNHDSAIAAAASRMVVAAHGRPCLEMGSRRTHEQAAVAAARAAYLAGFAGSSNLEAGRRHGIPTIGTAAHAFTLLHDDEKAAFAAQVAGLGPGTTLLVDTYDVERGVATAVEVAGPELGAVRLDSGDLLEQAYAVRAQLDTLGARNTRIVVTSDLDEYQIAALGAAPVDSYGVGTSLVTGSGAPTAGLVYKLVAREGSDGTMVGVAKRSLDKVSVGGRKWALRRRSHGVARAEVIGVGHPPAGDADDRALLLPLVRGGAVVGAEPLATARDRHAASLAELPATARQLSRGEPAIPTLLEPQPTPEVP
jgi:nicotinate phosphoribosyltransferase